MATLILLLLLTGCAAPAKHSQRCEVVSRVGRIATCKDGSNVLFREPLEDGDVVYYTPYTENEEVQIRGYVFRVERASGTHRHN